MLSLPNGQDYVAPEWQDLADKLVNGDGLGWSGDPRLYLQVIVAEETDTATGRRRTGRILEIRRENEDGSDTPIGHWRPDEQMRVCYDLARMRAEAPGPSIADAVDAANAAKEQELATQAKERMIETLDHAIRLHHDRNEPRNQFFMNGAPDRGGRA